MTSEEQLDMWVIGQTKHTDSEIWDILDTFYLVLSPQSIELSEGEVKEYRRFCPLAEYSYQYGIACKT